MRVAPSIGLSGNRAGFWKPTLVGEASRHERLERPIIGLLAAAGKQDIEIAAALQVL